MVAVKTPLEQLYEGKAKPVDVVPFKLYNILDFLADHPTDLHPEIPEYREYWLDQAENCIIGKWGYDFDEEKQIGGWRWMPGNLYFYVNMSVIEQEGEENTSVMKRPLLRNVEWMIFYALTTCDGFSGFENDEENCCFEPIKYIQEGKELSESLQMSLESYGDRYKKPNGEWKNYVEARQYLYRTHKNPLGKPIFHNEAKNLILLSSRRIGKSYSICVGVSLYDLVFNGSRSLADWLDKKTKTTTVLGSQDYTVTKEYLDKFESAHEHVRKKVGSFGINDGGDEDDGGRNGYFHTPLSGFGKVFKEKGGSIDNGKYGPGSKMVHVSYGKNPQAGVGYGARRMIIEEAGKVLNFNDIHRENSATQKRNRKYGYSVYIGTGGDIDKIKQIKEAFLNPKKYNCLEFEDYWGKSTNGIGLFFPCYYKNTELYDKSGNLLIDRSYKKELEEREEKKGSKDYAGHCISFPFRPAEMFVQQTGSPFPADRIAIRLQELEEGVWNKIAKVGVLYYTDKENKRVTFEEDRYKILKPILRFGDESNMEDQRGAFVQYEAPKFYKPDRYSKKPLYIAFYDSVAKDRTVSGKKAGSSLCSVLVIKLNDVNDEFLSFNIVAEWFGRYDELDDNHKMAWLIADYYGCKLFPETDLDDILRYSKKLGRWHDLFDKPSDTPAEIAKGGGSTKGFMITPHNKPDLIDYADQALKTVVGRKEFITRDEYTSEVQMAADRIPSMRMCDEFLAFNNDENFDGVSSYLLYGLYRRNKTNEPSESTEGAETNKVDDFNSYVASLNYNDHPAYNY